MKRFAALGFALMTLSFAARASAAPPAPQLTPGADVYSGYAAVAEVIGPPEVRALLRRMW